MFNLFLIFVQNINKEIIDLIEKFLRECDAVNQKLRTNLNMNMMYGV